MKPAAFVVVKMLMEVSVSRPVGGLCSTVIYVNVVQRLYVLRLTGNLTGKPKQKSHIWGIQSVIFSYQI